MFGLKSGLSVDLDLGLRPDLDLSLSERQAHRRAMFVKICACSMHDTQINCYLIGSII